MEFDTKREHLLLRELHKRTFFMHSVQCQNTATVICCPLMCSAAVILFEVCRRQVQSGGDGRRFLE